MQGRDNQAFSLVTLLLNIFKNIKRLIYTSAKKSLILTFDAFSIKNFVGKKWYATLQFLKVQNSICIATGI